MRIEILGTGCAKCKALEAGVREAVNELGILAEIVKVEDMVEIMKYGVMSTPALVVDGDVRTAGRVLNKEAIKKLLS